MGDKKGEISQFNRQKLIGNKFYDIQQNYYKAKSDRKFFHID
jgi:hypothetical protein